MKTERVVESWPVLVQALAVHVRATILALVPVAGVCWSAQDGGDAGFFFVNVLMSFVLFCFKALLSPGSRLSHVLSHGVAVFGGLVRGRGLGWVGTGGQIVGADGHSPGH